MLPRTITIWAQDTLVRKLICSLLIGLLVLSSLSWDVLILHACEGELAHSHTSRWVASIELSHFHGDDHHHHDHEPVDPIPAQSEQQNGCLLEAMVVTSGQAIAISRGPGASRAMPPIVPVSAVIEPIAPLAADGMRQRCRPIAAVLPADAHLSRSTVLLI